jgi:hypothetical protein
MQMAELERSRALSTPLALQKRSQATQHKLLVLALPLLAGPQMPMGPEQRTQMLNQLPYLLVSPSMRSGMRIRTP